MQYFGTDGIRQKSEKFTTNFLNSLANGLVDYAGSNIKVFLAGDTRESSERILRDLEIIFESLGVECANAGILPTPTINYCFYQMNFDFAIDVTASHNPYTDNGIKIFERGKTSGQKLNPKGCKIIESALAENKITPLVSPTIKEDLHQEAIDIYVKHLLDYIGDVNFSNLNIGIDCANGATSIIGDSVFKKLGAKTTLINCCKNYNTSINDNCGSTHLEALANLVQQNHLDFGIAFDGDGDRVLMVDNSGNTVDGDEIIAILTNFLNLNSIAITVMANQGLLNWAKDNQIKTEITAVGDSNVFTAMKEQNIPIGGEQSGHIILPNESTGDGMLTALMVTKAIVTTKSALSNLASIITKFPQIIINMPATPEQKTSLKTNENVKNILLEYNKKLEPVSGRLLVRPSGTENLIRITMWGNDESKITNLANQLQKDLTDTLKS